MFNPTGNRALFVTVIIALVLAFAPVSVPPAQAQANAPVYRVTVTSQAVSDDGQTLTVAFTVTNTGSAMSAPVVAYLVRFEDGTPFQISSVDVLPLAPNATSPTLRFPPTTLAFYEPGSRQVFGVELVVPVGIAGLFEGARFSIDIPARQDAPPGEPPVAPPPPDDAQNLLDRLLGELNDLWQNGVIRVPMLDLTIDLSDPQQRLIVLAILALAVLIILLIVRLWRLIFDRPPAFGTWQPPYAVMPHIDPYSTQGIRQGWQQFAQSNVITQPPAPEAAQTIKLLCGTDGVYLSGWQVIALRMTLYDQYGRVTRTQVLGSRKTVRRLNRLAQRRARLKPERAQRALRPLARDLARQFRRKLTPRNAILPAALDIRLRGRHGEVIIVFELYQNQQNAWQLLDRWQPEMLVTSRLIYDSYTYTVFGMTGGESLREYKKRLPDDILRWLVAFLAVPQPAPVSPPPAQPAPSATPASETPSRNRRARSTPPPATQPSDNGDKGDKGNGLPATAESLPSAPTGRRADVGQGSPVVFGDDDDDGADHPPRYT